MLATPAEIYCQGTPPGTPFVFLHIPKTAGTSLLTLLGNVFGDRQVCRIGPGEADPAALARVLTAPAFGGVKCLAGHLPVHLFAGRLGEFQAFTMLRHPIDRVMSLYRFLRRQEVDDLARMGLKPGFGFADFLAGRAPELFAQVRNGMCRLLCDLPALSDRNHALFWQTDLPGRVVDRALATVQRIDFGLTEAMPETLALLRAALGLPDDLAEVSENASPPPGAEWSSDNLLRLIELNAADLALYHEAATLFRARVAALRLGVPAGRAAERLTKLRPGVAVPVQDLPGRQGFHAFEPAQGFAWISGAVPARIAFAADPGTASLHLTLFAVAETYPVDEIAVTINGTPVPHAWVQGDGAWGELQTAPVPVAALNTLALSVPYTLPARFLAPASPDRRQLSVALAALALLPG